MDALFGDATTAMPTPATIAERESLVGIGSPVPSLDIRRGGPGPASAIPGLDIDPPIVSVHNGKPQYTKNDDGNGNEGFGGWISRMVSRSKGEEGNGNGQSGTYRALDQGEDD
jgi:hypothetical protein